MSLGQLTPTFINQVTDKLCTMYDNTEGTAASGFGMGDGSTFGAALKQSDLQTIIGNVGDVVVEKALAPVAVSWPNCTGAEIFGNLNFLLFNQLNRVALNSNTLSATIVSLDTLMSWFNVGNGVTYWQTLASPDWLQTYPAMAGGNLPTPTNLYFVCEQGQVYQGTTFTNALGKLVVVASTPTTTLGYTIPYTSYAGGLAYANVTAVTGTGVLTVVGKDQNNQTETWLYTVTGTGEVLMVPQTHAYSLITEVTSISVAAGITACTIYIEAHQPAGRTFPTT